MAINFQFDLTKQPDQRSILEKPFFERGTDAFREDLEARNGGLKISRAEDRQQIQSLKSQITADTMSDEEIERWMHRNPGAEGELKIAVQNRDNIRKLNEITQRNFSAPQPSFEQAGPLQPGEQRPTTIPQPGGFNRAQATQELLQAGLFGPETNQQLTQLQQAAAPPSPIKKSDLVQVQTPEGPRFVTAPEALGQAPVGKKGITFTTANGDVIEIGGTRGGLSKRTTAAQEKKLIDTARVIKRLDRIQQIAKPEFFTFQSAVKGSIARGVSKFGFELSKEQKANLQGRRRMVNAIEQEFNAYRKEITGAAAAIAELNVLRKSFLNSDLSFPEFQASFQEYRDKQVRALEITQDILSRGIPLGSEAFKQEHNRIWENAADTQTNKTLEELDAEIAELERQLAQ